MRAKLETLPMSELREVAKVNGIKGTTTMRKATLIDRILDAVANKEKGQTVGAEKITEQKQSTEYKSAAPQRRTDQNSLKQRTDVSKKPGNLTRTTNTAGGNPNQHRTIEKQTVDNSARAKYSTAGEAAKNTAATADLSAQQYMTPQQRLETLRKQALEEPIDMSLDSGIVANGILEIMPDGFGFIRCENYMPGDNDVYVSPIQIKKFGLKTGDIILGKVKIKLPTEKFGALLYINEVNGIPLEEAMTRKNFEELTPIFPNERLVLETEKHNMAMRIVDIISPIGKGQRGMIVSPPKAGKTTLLKEVAKSITINNPDMHLIILLIDERPEEVTDIKEAIEGKNVEVIYSTFDELPEHHKRVSEMVIERAKRLVEHGKDVTILLDSITRLARAYNIVIPASGRTLSGGLDPAALHMPKKFFGAARNMREGGSLTILATALVETGSRMDDVIFEEFKGTGNMELVLDRKLSEKRVFPAIDILKSGTRRDDLLLSEEEREAVDTIRKATNSQKPEDTVEKIIDVFAKTKNNQEFCQMIKKVRL